MAYLTYGVAVAVGVIIGWLLRGRTGP